MIKKKTPKSIITKKNLTLLVACTAFALSVSTILWFNQVLGTYDLSQKTEADSILQLTTRNLEQDYCIDNSIKPCTKENINKDAETRN